MASKEEDHKSEDEHEKKEDGDAAKAGAAAKDAAVKTGGGVGEGVQEIGGDAVGGTAAIGGALTNMGKEEKRPSPRRKSARKRPWLKEYENEPIGGLPGNHIFHENWQLALRVAFNGCLLASIIWFPITQVYVGDGLNPYVPVTVLVLFFNINKVFGCIVNGATACLIGVFWACLNIFILRGFFPDGVTPEMGSMSTAAIVGVINLMLFDLLFLTTDVRGGLRMFALVNNTNFLLMFLNPADQTRFSKNWKIDPNGTAVNCLKIAFIACCLTALCHLLPFPLYFAKTQIKVNAKQAAAWVAKNYIGSVHYYTRDSGSVLIEKQMRQTAVTEAAVGGMGSAIDGAWWEGFDVGNSGVIRNLHIAHQGLLGRLINIAKSVEIAISTEDFAASHKTIMNAIGESCFVLVDATGKLLMNVTEAAGDGDINSEEKKAMEKLESEVDDALKAVAKDFDTIRRQWTKIHKELLNESFFVFALSAYAREVKGFSDLLRNNPPQGEGVCAVLMKGLKSTFTMDGVGAGHFRIAARSWLALMLCFAYGVWLDNYGGGVAVTCIFLMSTRQSPEVASTLKALSAVIVASCVGAILFQRSCQVQALAGGEWVLPLVVFFFWWFNLYVNFSGGNFAQIGILCAALSAFVVVKRCPTNLDPNASAPGLFGGICGFIIALVIMTIAEIMATKGSLSQVSSLALKDALGHVEDAFNLAWDDKDPTEALGPVGGLLAEAHEYGMSAVEEPRWSKCLWKNDLAMAVHKYTGFLQLDCGILRHAMCGADGKTGSVFKVLNQVEEFAAVKKDLMQTLTDAKDVSTKLLLHTNGEFKELADLKSLEGCDELDGYDAAIEHVNHVADLDWVPKDTVIETLEDDLQCQISIIFVMLEFGASRISNIVKNAMQALPS